MSRTLVIIPTYNEKDNILELIKDIFIALPQADILVIDDNSPDGTGNLIKQLVNSNSQVKLITRQAKLGLGSAYVLGFRYALDKGYNFIFQMDADYSHHPRYLNQFLRQAEIFPLVLGSRYIDGAGIKGWGFFRRILSYLGNLYARCILRLDIRDLTGGYKCYQQKVLRKILSRPISSEGYVFQIETTLKARRAGFSVKEIPIVFENRRRGKSKISKKVILEAIFKVPLMLLERI